MKTFACSRLLPAALGTLALSASVTAGGTPAATDIDVGQRAFAACASCHQIGPSARADFGPQLNGVIGRRAGSTPDYKYSVAMKNANFVWDERRLAAFVRHPDAVVPGTKMRFFGIGYDEKTVAALLVYLRSNPASH